MHTFIAVEVQYLRVTYNKISIFTYGNEKTFVETETSNIHIRSKFNYSFH